MDEGARHPVIEASGLTKTFGGVRALDDVTFTIEGPGLTTILGPNGAGKTTLLDIIEGLAKPSSGTVSLFGGPMHPYPRRDVGVVLQREAQLEHATAGEYADLFAAIYGLAGGRRVILDAARLNERAHVALSRLSGGEAARLFVATATAHRPKLVLLDEPTAALDPENKRHVGEMLEALARTSTVVMTTHDLREADAISDDLVFLVGGRVRASGTRAELVAAVPESGRTGIGVEDAFFHFCSARMNDGALEVIS